MNDQDEQAKRDRTYLNRSGGVSKEQPGPLCPQRVPGGQFEDLLSD